jgi:endonuclease/exonuclease/phosphatase family metal-dependent hydrolase
MHPARDEDVASTRLGDPESSSRYVIAGDMNDPPTSSWLAPFVESAELRLRDALTDPVETRPARPRQPTRRTRRGRTGSESGQLARYELFDHIWLSEPLADRQDGAGIVRRRTYGGQGSDHDPAIVRLGI